MFYLSCFMSDHTQQPQINMFFFRFLHHVVLVHIAKSANQVKVQIVLSSTGYQLWRGGRPGVFHHKGLVRPRTFWRVMTRSVLHAYSRARVRPHRHSRVALFCFKDVVHMRRLGSGTGAFCANQSGQSIKGLCFNK